MRSSTWVATLLRDEGLISADQHDSAIQAMRRRGIRIEEALLDIRAIDEIALLKVLAAKFKTRFVSTEKLSQLDVAQRVLDMVPVKVADRVQVFPILFDDSGLVLSVVTADPDDLDMSKQVELVSGAREVRTYLARPAGIKAAIAKWYRRSYHAFATVAIAAPDALGDLYARGVMDVDRLGGPPAAPAESDGREETGAFSIVTLPARREPPTPPPPTPIAIKLPPPRLGERDFVETLNVLLSLLESSRAELRGHSPAVARLCRQMAERMGLPAAEAEAITMAAYLHDLGKMGGYHLTALNVAEYEGHKLAAQKSFSTPARLFETIRVLDPSFSAVSSMYERFDGSGFPARLGGKDIPLGARILAICDTYADLTSNPRNPFRRVLQPNEAHAALAKHNGTVFDEDLIDLFRHAVTGGDLRQKLLADRPVVLLVEPDAEDATVVELRLMSHGFEVQVVQTADLALAAAAGGDVDFVISEVELTPFDGFELLRRLHAEEQTRSLPFFFVARRFDTADVNRGFELGATEYFPKPAAPDVLAAKLRRVGEQQASAGAKRGVAGSLAELALPDLVQVLAQSRKSGRLSIRGPAGSGEVHFSEGAIVNASSGRLQGEDAFYALLEIREGDFSLDPTFVPKDRAITGSAEMLLLEGLRRMDEKGKG
ncbi:MAG: DUF4388 domain-containing protein [Deltaproteobacteria bacterium]|nr:DUF4388 domain-containing protein [Deltaproteobacteria bacterium]